MRARSRWPGATPPPRRRRRRLREVGRAAGRDDLAAEAGLLAGALPPLRGERAGAPRARGGRGGFAALALPLEAARARLALARVQAAAGSPLALGGRPGGVRRLERLGARREANEAAALLRELGVRARAERGERDELTPASARCWA